MDGKVKLVFITLILSALVMGCTSSEKVVKAGDTVSVDYTLRDVNGTVLETTNSTVAKANNIYNPANPYAPFSFVAGANTTISGFDEAVKGMSLNQTKNVTLTPDKAYGDYNASKVLTTQLETIEGNNTNFSQFVNQTIIFNEEYVYVVGPGQANNTALVVPLSKINTAGLYTITPDLSNKTATLDYNPPMAGKTLVFQITVVDIKTKA
jgi:peptidylprolyl isomerase